MPFPVEVMSIGTWNNTKFTLEDLKEIANNFNLLKDVIKPPIKLGHSGDQTGKPALGWVTNLSVKGGKLIAFLDDIPSILMKAIKKKLYRRVSSEIMFGFKYKGKTYGRVFSGLALLGAEMPAVKDLEDLSAYLTQTSEGAFEHLQIVDFQIDNNFNVPKKEIDKMETKEFQKKLDDLANQVATLTTSIKEKDQIIEKQKKELVEQGDKAKKYIQEQSVESLSQFCEERVKAGVMTPAQRDKIVGEKVTYLFSDEKVVISFSQFKEFIEAGEKKRDDKNRIKDDGKNKDKSFKDPQEEVDRLAKKYSVDNKVDYATAVNAILSDPENSKLAMAYTDDFDGVISTDDEE